MTNLLEMYIYLDKETIQSLYAQTVEALELEQIKSVESSKAGKSSLKIKIGQALGILLGLDIGAEVEMSVLNKHITKVKSHQSIEHKLRHLLEYLSTLGEGEYSHSLNIAMHNCLVLGKPVFINVRERFNLPQFYPGSDGVALVNQSKIVFFEIIGRHGGQYDYSDDYFKLTKGPVTMTASLSKFPRSSPYMPVTGHDAVIFRAAEGRDLTLSVFGQLISVNGFYHIKPLAIWL